jgi:hypothetical protein
MIDDVNKAICRIEIVDDMCVTSGAASFEELINRRPCALLRPLPEIEIMVQA